MNILKAFNRGVAANLLKRKSVQPLPRAIPAYTVIVVDYPTTCDFAPPECFTVKSFPRTEDGLESARQELYGLIEDELKRINSLDDAEYYSHFTSSIVRRIYSEDDIDDITQDAVDSNWQRIGNKCFYLVE